MENVNNYESFLEKSDVDTKIKEKTIKETQDHIDKVSGYLGDFGNMLKERGKVHDQCKLSDEELPYFIEYTPKLSKSEYGSDEYKTFLKELKPALDHHYKNSEHHPEHYDDGIKGMCLVDIVEMFCDWKASSERHETGDIKKSIKINSDRFKMGDVLTSIFENTVKHYTNAKKK